jgi:calcineurin-like phosphoesterase family protein
MIWFTSDTHFHHRGILRYERGEFFPDLETMNETLIQNWNNNVAEQDLVYHLGDLSFGNPTLTGETLSRLNGQIHLIRGNHDRKAHKLARHFASIHDYREIKIGEQQIVLSHYPFLTWNRAHHGAWMLHGHCHGSLTHTTQPRLDVGVDRNGFRPITFEQIVEIMEQREYTPVDHHIPNR